MRMYDIIDAKKRGEALSEQQIRYFIDGYVSGDIPDYQAAALCMAIYFRGMTDEECSFLTLAIRDSGDRQDFGAIKGLRVDKHSTGGVGDKTSLVVAPVAASLGVKVAKISGRGLGHTGGTIDKLESISGFNCNPGKAEFEKIVNTTGLAIIGQSDNLAPADKKLYALRDVTATVDSMPLIASSIMGKKLALGDDCIVLDVKCGSGSFMKTLDESRELARLMVNIGKADGRKMLALVTDMNTPLGCAVGNTLEVQEAIRTLAGQGPADLVELCTALAAHMLVLAGKGTFEHCRTLVQNTLSNGAALSTFARTVQLQGGNPDWIYHPELFPSAAFSYEVTAPSEGYVLAMNARGFGEASLMLGAGRNRLEDKIDPTAGLLLRKKPGDKVQKGEPIVTLFSSCVKDFAPVCDKILASVAISSLPPRKTPLILDIIE